MVSVIRRILWAALVLYILTLMIACQPTPATPVERAVLRPRIDTLWVEPVDSVLKCDLYWKPSSICWLITDSVKTRP